MTTAGVSQPVPATAAQAQSAPALTSRGQWAAAVAISAAIAAASLLLTKAFATDPAAWVVWARELTGPGKIATNPVGPGWKPLPVLLIAPVALITRGNADIYWWLFVCRFGVILGVLAAAAVARQYGGRAAAVLTAAMIVLSGWWLLDGITGRAEPLCGTLATFAFLAHRRDRIRWAFTLGVLAALIRPETWPFLALYGLWLWRRGRIPFWYLVLAPVIILGLWAVPEWHHTGPGSLAADKYGGSAPTAAVYASFPFLTIVEDAFSGLSALPTVLAMLGVALAGYVTVRPLAPRRLPAPPEFLAPIVAPTGVRVMALAAAGWVLLVAVMTQGGFSGSARYLDPALVPLTIVAALVAVGVAGDSQTRDARAWLLGTMAVVVLSVIWATHGDLHVDVTTLRNRVHTIAHLREEAAKPCPGPNVTGRNWFPILAEITGQSLPDSYSAKVPATSRKVFCS